MFYLISCLSPKKELKLQTVNSEEAARMNELKARHGDAGGTALAGGAMASRFLGIRVLGSGVRVEGCLCGL